MQNSGSSVQSLEIKINMGSAVNAMYCNALEVKIGSTLEAWCREEPLSALKGFRSTPYTLRTGFGILQLTHRIHTQEYYDNFNTPFTGGKVKKQSKAAEEFGEKKQ